MSSQSPYTVDLNELAKKAMYQYDLMPDYPPSVLKEAALIESPASIAQATKDLRERLFFSIDNDDSRDLDQLTYAEALPDGTFKIYIAIANVNALIKKGSAIDRYAQTNTVTVYTPSKIFPMLPEKFSTNFTSLNEDQDRLAIVVEIPIGSDGLILDAYQIYTAAVKNHAKLAYNGLSEWLEKRGPLPKERMGLVPGLIEQILLQDKIASILNSYRLSIGSLTLETIEAFPLVENEKVVEIRISEGNRAKKIIEEFMICANSATSRFFKKKRIASLRRVVRTPKRWDRIVEIALEMGTVLPVEPDSKALNAFLIQQRAADPVRFPDLSLTFIKLLGRGEYVVQVPDKPSIGHFNLAVQDYTHTTAPNRRYPDLITQMQLISVLEKNIPAFELDELEYLAKHCTEKSIMADKVERKMRKTATIILLSNHMGETFNGIITGKGDKGTWIRIFNPPTEGKLIKGYERVDIGDQVKVKLVGLDINLGYIDFVTI